MKKIILSLIIISVLFFSNPAKAMTEQERDDLIISIKEQIVLILKQIIDLQSQLLTVIQNQEKSANQVLPPVNESVVIAEPTPSISPEPVASPSPVFTPEPSPSPTPVLEEIIVSDVQYLGTFDNLGINSFVRLKAIGEDFKMVDLDYEIVNHNASFPFYMIDNGKWNDYRFNERDRFLVLKENSVLDLDVNFEGKKSFNISSIKFEGTETGKIVEINP